MRDKFLDKLLGKHFDELNVEELKLIINNDNVFSLSKKDKKVLEKIIENNSLISNTNKIVSTLQEGLPSLFEVLNNLDKYSINEGTIEINFREALLENLNKMNNLQLCIFVDKILKFGKDERLSFFRNKVYSLHEINSAISKSFNLTLAFEIFKPGKYKRFLAIDYNKIDKKLLVDTINNQVIHHLYILEIISEVVLTTEEAKIFGTKINKIIREQICEYVDIIHKERAAIRATGVTSKQTWTYAVIYYQLPSPIYNRIKKEDTL